MKINTDHNPDIARKYGVSPIPAIIFLNSDGQVIHKFVGYKSYEEVMQEVEKAKSKLE